VTRSGRGDTDLTTADPLEPVDAQEAALRALVGGSPAAGAPGNVDLRARGELVRYAIEHGLAGESG